MIVYCWDDQVVLVLSDSMRVCYIISLWNTAWMVKVAMKSRLHFCLSTAMLAKVYSYLHNKPSLGLLMKLNKYFSIGYKAMKKGFHAHFELNVQKYYWEFSNEVLYDVLSQGASKLPEIKDLDTCNLLSTRKFFLNF